MILGHAHRRVAPRHLPRPSGVKAKDPSRYNRRRLIEFSDVVMGNRCPKCGKPFSSNRKPAIDHFFNHSNTVDNFWVICEHCNNDLGSAGSDEHFEVSRLFRDWSNEFGIWYVNAPQQLEFPLAC